MGEMPIGYKIPGENQEEKIYTNMLIFIYIYIYNGKIEKYIIIIGILFICVQKEMKIDRFKKKFIQILYKHCIIYY